MRVLLTHSPQPREQYYGVRALGDLRQMGEVRLHDGDSPLAPDELVVAAQDVDYVIADRATAAPAEVFRRLPRLRAFLRVAVDIRNVDVAAASEAGILVTRAKPGFVPSVVELVLGFMIDLARGISRATIAYRSGRRPEIRMGRQLSGSTLGIVGYGIIGRRLAVVAAELGMAVLVSDPYADVDDPRFERVEMDDLLRRAHFVVCLAVANDETENLFDARRFRRMQPEAYFVNASRGNLVDEAALARALDEGWIAGAAMDVGRAPDQMPDPVLAARANVVATPHIGGLTPPSVEAQAMDTVVQLKAILAGDVPEGAANAASWSRRP